MCTGASFASISASSSPSRLPNARKRVPLPTPASLAIASIVTSLGAETVTL